MKTKILLITCLSLSALISSASSSRSSLMNAGDSYTYYHFNFDKSNFEPAYKPGDGIDWLFKFTPDESAFAVEVKSASTHPESSNFPNADLVIKNDFFSSYDLGIIDKNFHFIKTVNNGFVKYGRVDTDITESYNHVNIFNNPEVQVEFPLAVGLSSHDIWSGAYYDDQNKGSVYWSNGSTTYEPTEIGTIVINGREIQNTYRVERRRVYAENAAFKDFKLHEATYYEWFVEGIPFPVICLIHKKGFNGEDDVYEGYFIDDSFLANVGVDEVSSEISNLELYPNPSNGNVNIKYELNQPSSVDISVYNTTGMKVRSLVQAQQEAGTYHLNENLNLPSGMYLIHIIHNGQSSTKTLVLRGNS